jgi:pimeloyl-ACP methyl ester carboxylesterase
MTHSDPVLLLHGQPGAAGDWDRVRTAIGSRVETIAIDRPGWDTDSSPSDLEGNARAALDAVDAAGAERAVVVGHSFGGAVAAWLAATHPDRVRALVLAAPSANEDSLEWMDRWDGVLAPRGLG